MSVEELRKIAKEEASKFIMENLNSVIIFTYIQNLEKEIEKLKVINKEHQKLNEKIIQEMAEFIYGNDTIFYLPKDVNTKQEVIDYFRKRCKQ